MVIKKTRVPGCLKFYPRALTEDKRWLTVTYSWSALSEKGVVTLFRYDGEMLMRFKNTFRGLYYQVEPNRQILLSHCIQGSALMVVVDVRKRAKTFLRSQVFKLSAENSMHIYTTKGIAVGFLALEDNTRIQVRSDQPFVMKNQRRLRWDDPAVKLCWPKGFDVDPSKFIISVRDRYADTSWEMFRTVPDPALPHVDPEEEACEIRLDDVLGQSLSDGGEDYILDGDLVEPQDEFGEEEPSAASSPAEESSAENAEAGDGESENTGTAAAESEAEKTDTDDESPVRTDAGLPESDGEVPQEDEAETDGSEEERSPESGEAGQAFNALPGNVHEMLIVHDPLDLLDDLEGPYAKRKPKPSDIYTPDMPEITGSRATNAGITIFWKNDYYTRGYIVMRRAEGETEWTDLIRLPKGTAAYTDFTALPGVTYTYTVKGYAYGRGGVRLWSPYDEVGVTLSLTDTELTAPELISVVPQNGGYLVRWFKVEGAAGYRISRRSADSSEWTQIGIVSSDESAFLDLSAEDDQDLFYTVQAFSYKLNPVLCESGRNERGLSPAREK